MSAWNNTTVDSDSDVDERVYLSDPYAARREQLPPMMPSFPHRHGSPSSHTASSRMINQVQSSYVDPRAPKSPASMYSPTSLQQYAIFPGAPRSLAPATSASSFSHAQEQNSNFNYSHSPTLHPTSAASSNAGMSTTLPSAHSYPDAHTDMVADINANNANGSKKHVCSLCPAAFERRYDLKRHMGTHLDQKEFVCSGCNKALARNDSLQRHQSVCKARPPSSGP